MHSREFWELSKELMRRTEEACHRTAVSRAYYAAFHRTRDFLTLLGFRTRQSDQAHAGLYRRLSCTHREELDEAARSLMNLRGLRNSADYEIVPAFAKSPWFKRPSASERSLNASICRVMRPNWIPLAIRFEPMSGMYCARSLGKSRDLAP